MKNIVILLCFLIFVACNINSPIPSPKPRAYPKIEFPERSEVRFNNDQCPFTFEFQSYNELVKDSLFFDTKPINDCWFDLYCKSLNATLHCSYYEIDKQNSFDKLVTDAFKLSNKHNIKANYIDEVAIKKPGAVYGYVFNIEGDVASPFQFYLTDSTTHFLRASLYINAKARPDSLAPVYDFLKLDAMKLINSFEWKSN